MRRDNAPPPSERHRCIERKTGERQVSLADRRTHLPCRGEAISWVDREGLAYDVRDRRWDAARYDLERLTVPGFSREEFKHHRAEGVEITRVLGCVGGALLLEGRSGRPETKVDDLEHASGGPQKLPAREGAMKDIGAMSFLQPFENDVCDGEDVSRLQCPLVLPSSIEGLTVDELLDEEGTPILKHAPLQDANRGSCPELIATASSVKARITSGASASSRPRTRAMARAPAEERASKRLQRGPSSRHFPRTNAPASTIFTYRSPPGGGTKIDAP